MSEIGNRITYHQFVGFLNKRRLFGEFKTLLAKSYPDMTVKERFEWVKKHYHIKCMMSCNFVWPNETFKVWSKTNGEWKQYCTKKGITD